MCLEYVVVFLNNSFNLNHLILVYHKKYGMKIQSNNLKFIIYSTAHSSINSKNNTDYLKCENNSKGICLAQ